LPRQMRPDLAARRLRRTLLRIRQKRQMRHADGIVAELLGLLRQGDELLRPRGLDSPVAGHQAEILQDAHRVPSSLSPLGVALVMSSITSLARPSDRCSSTVSPTLSSGMSVTP